MKNYKGLFFIIGCCLFVILMTGTFMTSRAYFVRYSSKAVLFNGTMNGTLSPLSGYAGSKVRQDIYMNFFRNI